MNIQVLIDEKKTKLLVLEKYHERLEDDITDIEEELQQETVRVDQGKADQLFCLNKELDLLQTVPPAIDGKADKRRLQQQSKRPLTEKEIRLMQKKRLTPGGLFILSNRFFGMNRLFEIRALRQEIRHEWEKTCRELEREITRISNDSRPSDLQRTLKTELFQNEREARQREEKMKFLRIEITSLQTQLTLP